MRRPSMVLLGAFVFSLLFSSCVALRNGAPVNAAFEEKQESWTERNIPGVKSFKELIPPPTDARKQWDRYQRQRSDHWQEDPMFR